jgi:beta-lactamase class A
VSLTSFQRKLRAALPALALVPLLACTAPVQTSAPAPITSTPSAEQAGTSQQRQEFEQLERTFGARLGVYAVDTASGREVAFRADDRFAYASTHKAFTAAAVLQRTPIEGLEKLMPYTRNDLVPNSPIAEKHVDTGMTLRAAMDAALRYSDNTADNLLFRELGGPAALAAALRGIGDTTTHVDRIEPDLNSAIPGDIRDTSTPRAMTGSLRAFALGPVLPEDRRTLLTDMMRANMTGNALIRAGVPAGWQVGDKTGTADYATRNDIAVIWPPERAPIVLAIMSDRQEKDAPRIDKLIADATTVALKTFL